MVFSYGKELYREDPREEGTLSYMDYLEKSGQHVDNRTANEGPVRIQYKCLVSHLCILRNETVIFKTEL